MPGTSWVLDHGRSRSVPVAALCLWRVGFSGSDLAKPLIVPHKQMSNFRKEHAYINPRSHSVRQPRPRGDRRCRTCAGNGQRGSSRGRARRCAPRTSCLATAHTAAWTFVQKAFSQRGPQSFLMRGGPAVNTESPNDPPSAEPQMDPHLFLPVQMILHARSRASTPATRHIPIKLWKKRPTAQAADQNTPGPSLCLFLPFAVWTQPMPLKSRFFDHSSTCALWWSISCG